MCAKIVLRSFLFACLLVLICANQRSAVRWGSSPDCLWCEADVGKTFVQCFLDETSNDSSYTDAQRGDLDDTIADFYAASQRLDKGQSHYDMQMKAIEKGFCSAMADIVVEDSRKGNLILERNFEKSFQYCYEIAVGVEDVKYLPTIRKIIKEVLEEDEEDETVEAPMVISHSDSESISSETSNFQPDYSQYDDYLKRPFPEPPPIFNAAADAETFPNTAPYTADHYDGVKDNVQRWDTASSDSAAGFDSSASTLDNERLAETVNFAWGFYETCSESEEFCSILADTSNGIYDLTNNAVHAALVRFGEPTATSAATVCSLAISFLPEHSNCIEQVRVMTNCITMVFEEHNLITTNSYEIGGLVAKSIILNLNSQFLRATAISASVPDISKPQHHLNGRQSVKNHEPSVSSLPLDVQSPAEEIGPAFVQSPSAEEIDIVNIQPATEEEYQEFAQANAKSVSVTNTDGNDYMEAEAYDSPSGTVPLQPSTGKKEASADLNEADTYDSCLTTSDVTTTLSLITRAIKFSADLVTCFSVLSAAAACEMNAVCSKVETIMQSVSEIGIDGYCTDSGI